MSTLMLLDHSRSQDMVLAKPHIATPPTLEPVISEKFSLGNDQLIVVASFVLVIIGSCLGYLFQADVSSKKDLDKKLDDSKLLVDEQIADIRDKVQGKAEALTQAINVLSTATSLISEKMDLFIRKADELETQLDVHERILTRKIDVQGSRIDVLDKQNMVLLNHLQRAMRLSSANESALADVQSFLEGSLIETTPDNGTDSVIKRRYRKSKLSIDIERLEDLRTLVSDYNATRVSLQNNISEPLV